MKVMRKIGLLSATAQGFFPKLPARLQKRNRPEKRGGF
jgi:hypothetical protein